MAFLRNLIPIGVFEKLVPNGVFKNLDLNGCLFVLKRASNDVFVA